MSANSGRDGLINSELQSDLDGKGFRIKNVNLTDNQNVFPSTVVVTIEKTTGVLKGDNFGNAVAATAQTDFWDGSVALPSGANHAKGLVPDPGAAAGSTKFLREDMTFAVPAGAQSIPTIASTTVVLKGDNAGNAVAATPKTDFWDGTVFVASGASHAKGLVPDPGAGAGTTKFLREDSTWDVPPAAAGVVIASTTLVIKGDNAGGGVAATPGNTAGDYVAPSVALGRLLAGTTTLSGTTPTINWNTTTTFSWTLSGNSTPVFSNVTDAFDIIVAVTNTASNYTVTWPTVVWSGGVQPTQTIGAKTDLWGFKRIGSITYGAVVQNMS